MTRTLSFSLPTVGGKIGVRVIDKTSKKRSRSLVKTQLICGEVVSIDYHPKHVVAVIHFSKNGDIGVMRAELKFTDYGETYPRCWYVLDTKKKQKLFVPLPKDGIEVPVVEIVADPVEHMKEKERKLKQMEEEDTDEDETETEDETEEPEPETPPAPPADGNMEQVITTSTAEEPLETREEEVAEKPPKKKNKRMCSKCSKERATMKDQDGTLMCAKCAAEEEDGIIT